MQKEYDSDKIDYEILKILKNKILIESIDSIKAKIVLRKKLQD